MERRTFEIQQKGRTLYGYAARFGEPAAIGGFSEVIHPGAFTRTLSAPTAVNIRAVYEHDDKSLLGRVGSSTLRLKEDADGLAFELDLPDTTMGRDLAELVKRGDVAGCSFAFVPVRESWVGEVRQLHDVDLHEVTITATPAYPTTSVQVRSKRGMKLEHARRYLEILECIR